MEGAVVLTASTPKEVMKIFSKGTCVRMMVMYVMMFFLRMHVLAIQWKSSLLFCLVPFLSPFVLFNFSDMFLLLHGAYCIGSERRTTASTQMNSESSRSHLICSIVVRLTNKRTGTEVIGKLTLVDLAGSEVHYHVASYLPPCICYPQN